MANAPLVHITLYDMTDLQKPFAFVSLLYPVPRIGEHVTYRNEQEVTLTGRVVDIRHAQEGYGQTCSIYVRPENVWTTYGISFEEADYMRQGQKIKAIVTFRRRTGVSLKAAKEYIEHRWELVRAD